MTTDIESIGLSMDTSGVERGIKSLDELAARGPKVEKSLKDVGAAATQAGKDVSSIGTGTVKGLDGVAGAGNRAAQGLGQVTTAADGTEKAVRKVGSSTAGMDRLGAASAASAINVKSLGVAAVASERGALKFASSITSAAQSVAAQAASMNSARVATAAYSAQQSIATQQMAEFQRALLASTAAIDGMAAKSKELGGATEKSSRATKDASDSMALFGRAAIAALAGGVAFKSFVSAADAVTTLNNQLKLATGSAAAAESAYGSLYQIAQRSRVGFTELGTTYASISRATGELGISQQRMLKVTESIANAMTISGGSAQGMQAALVQLGQGMASGVLRGEELNSVMEQAPRLAKALADGLGVPIGKLREMGAAGEITAEQVVKALESQSAVLGKEVAGAALTVGQAFTQLSNASTNAIGEFDKATGTSASLAAAISSVAGAMDTMGATFKNNEAAISGVMGALAGAAALGTLAAIPRAIAAIGGAISGLGAVLAANPVVLTLLGIGAVVGAGFSVAKTISKTESGIKDAIETLKRENERSEALLQNALDGGRKAGASNISQAIEERKKAIRELNAELALMNTKGLDNSAEDARLARGTAEMNSQKRAAEELTGIRQKLSGVDKDYLPTLNKLFKQYQDGNIGLKEYQDLVGKLAKDTYKPEKQAAGVASLNTAYSSLTQSLREKIAAEKLELSGGTKLTEAQKARVKFTEDLKGSLKGLNPAQRAVVAAYLDEYEVMERRKDMAKEAMKVALEVTAARKKEADGIQAWINAQEQAVQQSINSVKGRIQGLKDEEQAIAISQALNISLAEAIEQVAISRLEEKQAGFNAGSKGWENIQREIDKRRELLGYIRSKAHAENNKQMLDEQKRAVQQYDDIFRQGFADMLNKGEDGWKSFTKSLATTFKTTVANELYKAFAQPFVVKIVGQLLGLTGNGASIAGAVSGGSGGLGGIGNIASGIGSLFGGGGMGSVLDLFGATGMGALDIGGIGLGSLGSSLASGFASIAGALGPIALGIGAVMAIVKSLDKSGTPHGGALAEYSAAGGLSTSQKHGAFGMGFGGVDPNETIKSFVGGLSTSIVGILDSVSKTFGGKGGFSVATGFADDSSKDGAWGGLLIKQMENVLVNWDDSRSSKWAPKVFADGEAGQKEYLAALAKDVTGVLKEMDLPGWAQDALNALGDTPAIEDLAKVIDQINATKAVFDTLGKNLVGFSGYADDATTALLKAAGGTEALAAAASTYYENYYSEAERQANATRDVTEALAKVNLALPTSREEYRKLVEQYTAMGADGADTLAVLLGLSGAFAAITPAGEAFGKTVDEIIASLRNPTRTNEDIARNTVGLEDRLFQAENKGNTAALRERELSGLTDNEQAILRRIHAIEDETRVASERASLEDQWLSLIGDSVAIRERERAALDETNRALYDQIQAERDRQAAAAEAAAAEASRASERSGIERDILSLQGDTAALRALELAGLDPANRALKEHYYALLDEKNAAEAAAAAVRAAANEHASLQERLWQIEGNTGALREAALKKLLDDESRDLQKRIWAAEDAAEAARAYEAASRAAAAEWQQFQQAQLAAAQAVKEAWTSVGETILDEVKRLRGEVTGGSPQSMAQAQAAFAIATAQARAGDQDAAKQLPSLSKALEDIAKKQAASSLDLWRVQTTTAASLELTAKMLAEKFGFTLPSFAVGTTYVPQDMVAQIHKGEAIVPAAFNPMLTGGSNNSGNAELVAEVRALRQQVAELQATADKTERNTKRTSDDLDDFSRNGMPTINQPGTTLATV